MAREHYLPTGCKTSQDQEKRALGAEHDRQVRHRSVANDIRLDLPVSIARPDGEEYPGRPRLRSQDKRNEIQKLYIQGPPNKTVWDSIDCKERTVTQPSSSSSSSSSRSGGNKSASKSSSIHWGIWSRTNKSPPSQGRTSRGQSRHASNPSTCVRNAPNSSSCETARGKYGGGNGAGAVGGGGGGGSREGGVIGPTVGHLLSSSLPLSSLIPSSSSSTCSLGTHPNSSPHGFHGAATSLVAGDTVHSAFANHNQLLLHHHQNQSIPLMAPQQSSLQQSSNKSTRKTFQQQSTEPFPSSAGGGGQVVQDKHFNQFNDPTRTSPNNNSSTAMVTSPPTRIFTRSQSCSSKESKRSNNNVCNNGKNGKSHRTDQLSCASVHPSSSPAAHDDYPAASLHQDNNINPNCSTSRMMMMDLPNTERGDGSGKAAMCGGPSSPSSSPHSSYTRGGGGVEHMMTTDDAYCCDAEDRVDDDDDGARHYTTMTSSDNFMKSVAEGERTAMQQQQHQTRQCSVGPGQGVSDMNNTLKLSPSTFMQSPSSPPFRGEAEQKDTEIKMSTSVPTTFSQPKFNQNFSKGVGMEGIMPGRQSEEGAMGSATCSSAAAGNGGATGATVSTPDSQRSLVSSERKRNIDERCCNIFSPSGYTTDPNYSTFTNNKSNNSSGTSSNNNNESPPSPPNLFNYDKSSCNCSSSCCSCRNLESQRYFGGENSNKIGGAPTTMLARKSRGSSSVSSMEEDTEGSAKVGNETAHHRELSDFIASTDQYCTAAELTISSSSQSSSSSSSQAARANTQNSERNNTTNTSLALETSSANSESSSLSQTSNPALSLLPDNQNPPASP